MNDVLKPAPSPESADRQSTVAGIARRLLDDSREEIRLVLREELGPMLMKVLAARREFLPPVKVEPVIKIDIPPLDMAHFGAAFAEAFAKAAGEAFGQALAKNGMRPPDVHVHVPEAPAPILRLTPEIHATLQMPPAKPKLGRIRRDANGDMTDFEIRETGEGE